MKPVRQLHLANGLTVTVYNYSRRYFGDYHQVKVEFLCEIPILEEYFAGHGEFLEARSSLGDSVLFRRYEEKMGVASADLETVLESIIRHFSEHSQAYLSAPDFPRKMIAGELAKTARQPVLRSYTG